MPQDLVAAMEAASYRYGDSYDSYLINEPNRSYLVLGQGEGFVGFVVHGRYLNLVSGLIAAPEKKTQLLDLVREFAASNRLTVSVFNVREDDLDLFAARGFQITKFAEDFLIDLNGATFKGGAFDWVRRQSNFVSRHGGTFREECLAGTANPSGLTPQAWHKLIDQLQRLEDRLLATKPQGRPTAVFQGRLDGGQLGRRRLFVAYQEDGTPIGFIVLNPYNNGRAFAVEIFRYDPAAIRGTTAFLIHQAALTLIHEKVDVLSLSVIPGIGCDVARPGDSRLCRLFMVIWSRHLNFISDMRGVYHFKSRFRPRTESRFVCVSPKVTLGSTWAFLQVWGIAKVHPLRILRSALRLLRLRALRANLVDPTPQSCRLSQGSTL